ncbi:MAG: CARDB domain-containing protein [Halioglobus sp.]|nr:CARDB domain-containing protein [Halioglobus sp.]
MELTFENNGEKNTESPDIGFYLSTNSIISSGDTLLRTDTGYSLGRNTPYEVTENVTIPIDTEPGNYFLGAFVDHDNLITETTGGNNVAYYPVTVLAPPSDLTVPFAGVDDILVAPNETFKLIAIVRNDGIGPADTTTLRYYRSSNSTISSFDTQVTFDIISGLDSGEQSAENADTMAPGSEGTWYYGACVDSVPRETSTTNNCSSGTQVTVAWPAPDATTNPATDIDTTSADLNATFDPFGAPHTVYFDWGETTAYGNTVEYTGPIFAGNISVTLSGLVCNTEYHLPGPRGQRRRHHHGSRPAVHDADLSRLRLICKGVSRPGGEPPAFPASRTRLQSIRAANGPPGTAVCPPEASSARLFLVLGCLAGHWSPARCQ